MFLWLSGVLLEKQVFKRGMVAILLFNIWLWWLLADVGTRL